MTTEPRSTFLMVCGHAALVSANEELAAYQSVLRSHAPGQDLEPLLGIWVDEDGVANLPCALVLPDITGARRTVRILEAMGINGIWMLCWLEVAASTVSRLDLVAALLASFGHDDTENIPARFIPVYTDTTPESGVSAGRAQLEARYPALVLPPIIQNCCGSLILPMANPHKAGPG